MSKGRRPLRIFEKEFLMEALQLDANDYIFPVEARDTFENKKKSVVVVTIFVFLGILKRYTINCTVYNLNLSFSLHTVSQLSAHTVSQLSAASIDHTLRNLKKKIVSSPLQKKNVEYNPRARPRKFGRGKFCYTFSHVCHD